MEIWYCHWCDGWYGCSVCCVVMMVCDGDGDGNGDGVDVMCDDGDVLCW